MKRINLSNLLFNIFVIVLTLLIIRNFVKYNLNQNKLKQVEAENIAISKQIEEVKKDIDFAKSPEFIEKIAREKFDMIKDDELIIIFENEQK